MEFHTFALTITSLELNEYNRESFSKQHFLEPFVMYFSGIFAKVTTSSY